MQNMFKRFTKVLLPEDTIFERIQKKIQIYLKHTTNMDIYGSLPSDPLASGVIQRLFPLPQVHDPCLRLYIQLWIQFWQFAVGKGPCCLRKIYAQLLRNINIKQALCEQKLTY